MATSAVSNASAVLQASGNAGSPPRMKSSASALSVPGPGSGSANLGASASSAEDAMLHTSRSVRKELGIESPEIKGGNARGNKGKQRGANGNNNRRNSGEQRDDDVDDDEHMGIEIALFLAKFH